MRLKRDLGVQTVIGNLWDRTTTSNQYALGQGYDNYEQYNFAYQIQANYGRLNHLIIILNQSEFKKVQDEIVSMVIQMIQTLDLNATTKYGFIIKMHK